jgi:endonuclease YncB( thermonuclease family)
MRAVGILIALWFTAVADSETLTGRVVGISDGDTITVLVAKQQVKVRINGIDAPEKRQPYGERSKQNLSAMAFKKDARLECHKTDRYGRQVCKVWVQPGDCPGCGLTLDVGLAQVIAGMALWYREYAKEQTAEDQGRYETAENEARLRRWGLWNDPQPVPPWDWRRREWEKRQPAIGY